MGGLTLFAAQGCKAPKQVAEQAEHPNIIYVFPDQYRNQAMGFWNQEGFRDKVNFRGDPVHTPNIDTFARESMVLTSAQSNCPLSSPHRGMLLTGMYPNRSGVPLNCNSTRPISSLRDDAECIGDVFSKAGYDCAYFGKLHADFPTPNDPENPGQYVETQRPVWDAYTPKEQRHGFNYWYSYGTFDEHKNPHYWDTDGKRHDPKEWSPLHESGKVVSYLKNEGNVRDTKKPFFIMVGMNPPHSPYRSLNDCEEQDFNLYNNEVHAKFDDYDLGMEYARQHGKPVMLDFTGYGCVNCRKMELAVWTDPKVSDIINNDYVLITLYVDNKTPLSSPVKIVENGTERTLRTVGDKWSYLQRVKFGANAQPFYVLINNAGEPLNKSYSYDESIPKYIEFLQTGLENYRKEK